MSPRARRFALALLLPLAAACEDVDIAGPEASDGDALEAVLSSSALTSTAEAGPRDGGGGPSLFEQLAAEIPEFGGLFRTDRCAVGLVLTSLEHEQRAEEIVKEVLERLLGDACPNGVRVNAQRGEFTWLELVRWLHASRPLHEIRGVIGIKIDYAANRLVVTVTAHAVVEHVLEALPRLGIPASAVLFEVGDTSGRRG